MATAVHVSLAEYLSTDYEPDCEYLDGVVEERSVGKRQHSRTQALVAARLQLLVAGQMWDVLVEQRIQFSPSRVRIPDVCLITADNKEEVIQSPPALWVEILSPEDRWARVQAKIDDCQQFGVKTIWIIDPYDRRAWIVSDNKAVTEVRDGQLCLAEPSLTIALSEILPQE